MGRFCITESEQRERFIGCNKFGYCNACEEVPVFSRSVDLVTQSETTGELTAIEFKLSDWKRAVKQALRVAICFDYIEICIMKPKTEKGEHAVLRECEKLGIGVYFYDEIIESFIHMLEPVKIEKQWNSLRSNIIEYIRREQDGYSAEIIAV